jgi:hypothetical protein
VSGTPASGVGVVVMFHTEFRQELRESAFVEELVLPLGGSPKNEIITACNMLNRMTNLEMPCSERLLVA